jgi:cell division septation protein DedD
MKKYIYVVLPLLVILLITACKPPHHPKNPNYNIIKPKIIHTPTQKNLNKMVKKLQGSPYVWAEEGPHNFDCSGFTYYMYGSMGIEIPRVAREQAKVGKRVAFKDLKYGDLIFFATNSKKSKKITHVGMYLGNGWFTHASTIKHEVIYSNLFTSPYYKKRLRVCRRYLPETTTPKLASASTPWKTKEVQPKPVTIPRVIKPKQIETMKKAIVIKTAMKDIEQTAEKGTYYIQVGSFIGKPKSKLLYSIRNHGLQYKIIKFTKERKPIFKLLIGPYIKKSDAAIQLNKVRKNIQKDAFIAEIR